MKTSSLETRFLFQERAEVADCPAGWTVSKRDLPGGDFGITEWVWGDISLWFVDADRFTAGERQEAYRVAIGFLPNEN